MPRVSLRRLEVFKAIVDFGGLNAAAQNLGVAPPSVTAHLNALEREMGSRLFVRRRGARSVVTPSGRALYDYACRSIEQSDGLRSAVRALEGAAQRTLSLGVQRPIANQILPSVLAPLLQRRPDVRISIHCESQDVTLEQLRSGKIDAAILFATPQTSSFETVKIGYQKLVFVAAPDHPLAKAGLVPIETLASHDFVGGLRDSQFFALIERTLQAGGLLDYRVVLHIQDPAGVKSAAMHGLGIACTLRSSVEQEIAQGKLAVIETRPAPAPLAVVAISRLHSPASNLLAEILPSLARELAQCS